MKKINTKRKVTGSAGLIAEVQHRTGWSLNMLAKMFGVSKSSFAKARVAERALNRDVAEKLRQLDLTILDAESILANKKHHFAPQKYVFQRVTKKLADLQKKLVRKQALLVKCEKGLDVALRSEIIYMEQLSRLTEAKASRRILNTLQLNIAYYNVQRDYFDFDKIWSARAAIAGLEAEISLLKSLIAQNTPKQ